jgi:isopentenyl-diphosphate delta-isomerase
LADTRHPDTLISRRKSEHLRIVLEEQVTHVGGTWLDDIHLLHDALPELDLMQPGAAGGGSNRKPVDTSVEFFGKRLRSPLMITSMTGGAEATRRMNADLAAAASRCGVAFAVGSQRVLLKHPEVLPDFAVRAQIPDGVLLGNIGGVQLPQLSTEEVASLVERIDADGICVHLNPAQELCQPEGDRDFSGVLDGIARLLERLEGRVLIKETGAGLSPRTLQRLAAIGVTCVDVAGRGGTSWTKVEMLRALEGPTRAVGRALAEWGVPTAFSIVAARRVLGPGCRIVGSGGVTNGLDCARAIAAGADVAGFARAALMAWNEGGLEGAVAFIERLEREVRAVMLVTGSADVESLKRAPRVYGGELRSWLESWGWLGGQ